MPRGRHQHVARGFLLRMTLTAYQRGCSWMGEAQVAQQAPDGCLPPLHRTGWVIYLATYLATYLASSTKHAGYRRLAHKCRSTSTTGPPRHMSSLSSGYSEPPR